MTFPGAANPRDTRPRMAGSPREKRSGDQLGGPIGRCPGMPRRFVLAAVVSALVATTAACQARLPEAPECPVLPDDSIWHADVSKLPVDPRSSAYVAAIGAAAPLKADFGSGLWDGGPIGIPYAVVDSHTPRVAVSFDYADESDAGPYPIPDRRPDRGRRPERRRPPRPARRQGVVHALRALRRVPAGRRLVACRLGRDLGPEVERAPP